MDRTHQNTGLWREYRASFEEFSQRARAVQKLQAKSNPDLDAIETAWLELEQARLKYGRCRDLLAFAIMFPSRTVDRHTSACANAR